MKKFYILISIFFLALSISLGLLVFYSMNSIHQEEIAEAKFFSEALFDQIENEIETLVIEEEARSIQRYFEEANTPLNSSNLPSFIIAYFQNNADGTVTVSSGTAPDQDRIKKLNIKFNQIKKKPYLYIAEKDRKKAVAVKKEQNQLQQKYLSKKSSRSQLLKERQAYSYKNRVMEDFFDNKNDQEAKFSASKAAPPMMMENSTDSAEPLVQPKSSFDPMRAVFLDESTVFLFRRTQINDQIQNQGVAIDIQQFVQFLSKEYFEEQPIATYSSLLFSYNKSTGIYRTGPPLDSPVLSMQRTFGRPFSFINAAIEFKSLPVSSGRQTIWLMSAILFVIIFFGLGAILKAMHVTVDHSLRRAGFVSSVTHELKTPITNIGMYVEMLEQGIADTPDKKNRYYTILKSEILRLSKLIQNILEFSRLESRTRKMTLETGDVRSVIDEVEELMDARIREDGFLLDCTAASTAEAQFDREALLQVLINLVDNSIKFGKNAALKEIHVFSGFERGIPYIKVTDFGPGIPESELGKVFNDFYRVDNSLTSKTQGTGIGLALVKKLVLEMDGTVSIMNNENQRGCTVSVLLVNA